MSASGLKYCCPVFFFLALRPGLACLLASLLPCHSGAQSQRMWYHLGPGPCPTIPRSAVWWPWLLLCVRLQDFTPLQFLHGKPARFSLFPSRLGVQSQRVGCLQDWGCPCRATSLHSSPTSRPSPGQLSRVCQLPVRVPGPTAARELCKRSNLLSSSLPKLPPPEEAAKLVSERPLKL